MNHGNIHNPNTDEGRLYAALSRGAELTPKQIQKITGAAAHTPVISGVRQGLAAENSTWTVRAELKDTHVNKANGRRRKLYVYRLAIVDSLVGKAVAQ
jgi:hypothetical protein